MELDQQKKLNEPTGWDYASYALVIGGCLLVGLIGIVYLSLCFQMTLQCNISVNNTTPCNAINETVYTLILKNNNTAYDSIYITPCTKTNYSLIHVVWCAKCGDTLMMDVSLGIIGVLVYVVYVFILFTIGFCWCFIHAIMVGYKKRRQQQHVEDFNL
jgi:hypothetical protein